MEFSHVELKERGSVENTRGLARLEVYQPNTLQRRFVSNKQLKEMCVDDDVEKVANVMICNKLKKMSNYLAKFF